MFQQHALVRDTLAATGPVLDDLVESLRATLEVPLATLAVLHDGRFHFLVTAGAEPFTTDEDDAVCRVSMGVEDVVVIPDLAADERTRDLPWVDGRHGSLRFYASAPVHAPDRTMVGRLCVFDTEPRELTETQRLLLTVLARSASDRLDLRMRSTATVTQGDADVEDPAVASRVEHDLRSPLSTLRSSLHLLVEIGPPDDRVRQLVGTAQGAARRLEGLVEGLSTLHSMSTPPRPHVVHLGDVVRTALDELEHEVSDSGANVEAVNLPVLTCDPSRIAVVLRELLANALRFRRDGVAPRVSVTAHRVGLIDWRVSVTDDGIGIPLADRTRVLEVLTRLTTRPGHGLGLATVRRAVAGHGGRVGIEDGPGGVGTTVWFELPG